MANNSALTIAHVFTYRWHRLKEGLTHKEEIIINGYDVSTVNAPEGSYIRLYGLWYYKPVPVKQDIPGRAPYRVPYPKCIENPQHIPKDILAMALLLNI